MGGHYERLVNLVRVLLGLDLVVNGLNWWVKLVTPYPSIADFVDRPPPPDFVGAMIATGFLFHVVKGLELLAGIALLANRFVPLALIASLPISINIFLVDVFLAQKLRAYVMGTGELLMNLALMMAYLEYFRALVQARSVPDGQRSRADVTPAENAFTRAIVAIRPAVMAVSAILGVVMIAWVAVMIAQRQLQ
jgi:hypothetical protein